jgi:CRP-like cAMP-binding protein
MTVLQPSPIEYTSTYSGNKLLASLSGADFERIAPHLRSASTYTRHVLQKQGEPIENVFFPTSGAYSLVKLLSNGQAAEVATIGSDGAFGIGVFLGERTAECALQVVIPGAGVYMSAEVFTAEMNQRAGFFNHLIRYSQSLMHQMMQTTACNSLHSAEQRVCRWLLTMRETVGQDQFPMTHETLATMLGVRRPTVTIVAGSLQHSGVIQHRRGFVTIVDGEQLEVKSCECYEAMQRTSRRLLPEIDAPRREQRTNSNV